MLRFCYISLKGKKSQYTLDLRPPKPQLPQSIACNRKLKKKNLFSHYSLETKRNESTSVTTTCLRYINDSQSTFLLIISHVLISSRNLVLCIDNKWYKLSDGVSLLVVSVAVGQHERDVRYHLFICLVVAVV